MEWIKCSERMPDKKEFMLAYDGIEVVRAYYYADGGYFLRDNGDQLYRVTHWMVIVEPED